MPARKKHKTRCQVVAVATRHHRHSVQQQNGSGLLELLQYESIIGGRFAHAVTILDHETQSVVPIKGWRTKQYTHVAVHRVQVVVQGVSQFAMAATSTTTTATTLTTAYRPTIPYSATTTLPTGGHWSNNPSCGNFDKIKSTLSAGQYTSQEWLWPRSAPCWYTAARRGNVQPMIHLRLETKRADCRSVRAMVLRRAVLVVFPSL
jgi:hypothetical protein